LAYPALVYRELAV